MLIASGNFLMVIIGPSSDIGGNTICTLEPSDNLASAIGEDTFTTLFTLLTICCIISSKTSLLTKDLSHLITFPHFSTKISSFPFTIISVISLESNNSCNISSLLNESNNELLIFNFSSRGI